MSAAVEASTIMVLLTNPLWLIKTRMEIQGQSAAAVRPYRGVLDAATTIVKEEGMLGLYKGRRHASCAFPPRLSSAEVEGLRHLKF
eukprot:scaffold302_cov247-Pinguiococcus_pyrenoidosus.AAC.3